MGGGWRCSQRGGVCPASSRLRRVELFVTEMAEGELDVDSLISRLLEGEFATILHSCYAFVCGYGGKRLLSFHFDTS